MPIESEIRAAIKAAMDNKGVTAEQKCTESAKAGDVIVQSRIRALTQALIESGQAAGKMDTYGQIGAACGVSQNAVCHWVQALRQPSGSALKLLGIFESQKGQPAKQ